jgi:hypothetical protein
MKTVPNKQFLLDKSSSDNSRALIKIAKAEFGKDTAPAVLIAFHRYNPNFVQTFLNYPKFVFQS